VLWEGGGRKPAPYPIGERPLLAYAVEKLGFPLRALFRPQSIESDNRQ
jgi:hypothetical protein